MIYVILTSAGLAGLFLYLFIRAEVANGKLKLGNAELSKNADIKQKQLEIAANHPDTPADLAKRMRDGTL